MSSAGQRVRLGLVATVVVALVAPRLVAAEDLDSLVRTGVQLRHQGRDREALETFQRAAAIKRQPRVVAQIGLAEQALGLWPAAAEHVEEALAAAGDDWIGKNRRSLEQTFEVIKAQVGRVEVWGSPPDAEVLVDGRRLGRLADSKSAWVGAEPAQLTVRAPGFAELVRTVQVRAGEFKREHVELRPLSLAPLAAAVVPPPPITPPPPGEPEHVPVPRRWWFWTALAAVAVGAGVATAVALSSGGGACDGVKGPCTVYKP
jgi:hypothetical protein